METTLSELGELVDVFLVVESTYTNYGDPKKLILLEQLKDCLFHKYQHKIVYVHLDYFPSDGRQDGSKADNLPRIQLSDVGLRNQIHGLRPDDLFFYF